MNCTALRWGLDMAYATMTFDDSLMNDLQNISNTEEIIPKMLNEAGEITLRNYVKEIKSKHKVTGDLWKSIVKFKPIFNAKYGYWKISCCPTGKAKSLRQSGHVYKRSKSGTMTRGVSMYNSDKMFFLEFGTSNQSATPVLEKITRDSETQVIEKLQEVYNREISSSGVSTSNEYQDL